MIRIVPLFVMALMVSGCFGAEPTIVIKEVPKVFIPDDEFFVCPVVDRFPNFETITDGQIAELLIRLNQNNVTCFNSMAEVRRQLITAKNDLENIDIE